MVTGCRKLCLQGAFNTSEGKQNLSPSFAPYPLAAAQRRAANTRRSR